MTSASIKSVLCSDKQHRDEWYTPTEIIEALGPFDLDPACGQLCAYRTAKRRFGPEEDGLQQLWAGRVWLNPPFSNANPWVDKLIEHGNGILLTFCRSDASWFHRAIDASGGVLVFIGRTQYRKPDGVVGSCPLGSSLIPFGKHNVQSILNSGLRGKWLVTP